MATDRFLAMAEPFSLDRKSRPDAFREILQRRDPRELSRSDQECIFTCRPANISPATRANGFRSNIYSRQTPRENQRHNSATATVIFIIFL